jgi:hypothetical protein
MKKDLGALLRFVGPGNCTEFRVSLRFNVPIEMQQGMRLEIQVVCRSLCTVPSSCHHLEFRAPPVRPGNKHGLI